MHSLLRFGEMNLAATVVAVALLTVASCQVQLPCDSPLRVFPSLARFFEHCECLYEETELGTMTVPAEQCRSELAVVVRRRQLATSGDECEDITEETYECVSTCQYGNWADAVPYDNATPVPVPVTQCPSGSALPGERWQTAIDGYECIGTQCEECQDKSEEIYLCKKLTVYKILSWGIYGIRLSIVRRLSSLLACSRLHLTFFPLHNTEKCIISPRR